MIRRPPRSTLDRSSAASDVYKRQVTSSVRNVAPDQIADSPRPTTIVEAPRLGAHLGIDVFLATETFQRTGSFKFRAAYNVALNVPNPHIIAASSGNFGQA